MDANNFAGSDFLKAADLGTSTPQIRISKVESVDFPDGPSKLVIHPTDPAIKPVVLNVTNTRACIASFGPDTDRWINQVVMLSVRQTQMGPGIGVTPMQAEAPLRLDPASAPTVAAPQLPSGEQMPGPNATSPGVPFNDDIPY